MDQCINLLRDLKGGQQHFRILITEDKLENRLLLHDLLEPLGFELRVAVNGREAIEQFEKWHPHLIWMDIRMPVMNGLEATRFIKESTNGNNTKIVALTAHALEAERIEILEAGCDDFIRKPYRDTEIYMALSKHLGIRLKYADNDFLDKASGDSELDKDQLKEISPELLENLREAAVLLDSQACLKIAGLISKQNHELGSHLYAILEGLQYKKLLHVLDNLDNGIAK